jgi:hypothetical protein
LGSVFACLLVLSVSKTHPLINQFFIYCKNSYCKTNREPHQTIITNTAESTKQPCRDAAIQEEAPFFRISVTPMIQHSPSSINSQRQHKTLTAGAALSSTIVCFSLSIIFVAQQLQLFLTPQGVADILL